MVSQFERTYVTSTGLGGTGPGLIFEGNIAPPFFIVSPTYNVALVATPKVVLRMFNARSKPVKTPSYMPRATLYWFLHPESVAPGRGARYLSVTLSHHSNGQDGPVFNPDGTVNHESGSFSTNFVEFAYAGRLPLRMRRKLHARYSLEIHPPGWYDAASNVGYSHVRAHVGATAVQQVDTSSTANCWRALAVGAFAASCTGLRLVAGIRAHPCPRVTIGLRFFPVLTR
jgi:hypothetical protein